MFDDEPTDQEPTTETRTLELPDPKSLPVEDLRSVVDVLLEALRESAEKDHDRVADALYRELRPITPVGIPESSSGHEWICAYQEWYDGMDYSPRGDVRDHVVLTVSELCARWRCNRESLKRVLGGHDLKMERRGIPLRIGTYEKMSRVFWGIVPGGEDFWYFFFDLEKDALFRASDVVTFEKTHPDVVAALRLDLESLVGGSLESSIEIANGVASDLVSRSPNSPICQEPLFKQLPSDVGDRVYEELCDYINRNPLENQGSGPQAEEWIKKFALHVCVKYDGVTPDVIWKALRRAGLLRNSKFVKACVKKIKSKLPEEKQWKPGPRIGSKSRS